MPDLSAFSSSTAQPTPVATSAAIGLYSGTGSGSAARLFPTWSASAVTYLRGELVLVGSADAGILYVCVAKTGTATSSGSAPGTATLLASPLPRYPNVPIWTTADGCSWGTSAAIGNGLGVTNTGSATLSIGEDPNLAANSTARYDIAAGASIVLNPAVPPAWWYVIGSSTYSVVVQA